MLWQGPLTTLYGRANEIMFPMPEEEKSDWKDTTTSEDIDEMLHWRETSCGIDDATLAALLIGRGGAMRVSIFHPKLMNDNTFERHMLSNTSILACGVYFYLA